MSWITIKFCKNIIIINLIGIIIASCGWYEAYIWFFFFDRLRIYSSLSSNLLLFFRIHHHQWQLYFFQFSYLFKDFIMEFYKSLFPLICIMIKFTIIYNKLFIFLVTINHQYYYLFYLSIVHYIMCISICSAL